MHDIIGAESIVVKALEEGVTVIGLTRGKETIIRHTEKLDSGEVWISQFTEHVRTFPLRRCISALGCFCSSSRFGKDLRTLRGETSPLNARSCSLLPLKDGQS